MAVFAFGGRGVNLPGVVEAEQGADQVAVPHHAVQRRDQLASRFVGFALADPDHGDAYARNGEEAAGQLPSFAGDCTQALEGAEGAALITFHDGFRYFAQALGLPLLASIEEEEGSEASAMEINEITQLVKEHQLPVIFTEVNGSDATANAISRETGCQVAQLTMLMDGPEEGDLSTYLEGVRSNVNTIVSFFGGEELDQL